MSRVGRVRLLATGVSGVLLVVSALVVAFTMGPSDEPAPAAAVPTCPSGASIQRTPGACARPTSGPVDSLRSVAERRGIRLGAAVDTTVLVSDSKYRAILSREFSSLTPENAMKWGVVEAQRGQVHRTGADRLAQFARQNKQEVFGHTLVWHRQLPSWLTSGDLSASELNTLLHKRITEEVTHFRDVTWAWDVVNEVLDEDGDLRRSMWWEELGPDYIADAFRWARAADPDAKLFINDYNIEGINRKSNGLYRLVRDLLDAGVPIDGVGFQAHWRTNQPPQSFVKNLRRFTDLGLDVAITELDVRVKLPASGTDLVKQADIYGQATKACLAVPRCVALTIWSFTDSYSWVPGFHPGYGSAGIFDGGLAPKPAYSEVLRALIAGAAVRPRPTGVGPSGG